MLHFTCTWFISNTILIVQIININFINDSFDMKFRYKVCMHINLYYYFKLLKCKYFSYICLKRSQLYALRSCQSGNAWLRIGFKFTSNLIYLTHNYMCF